MSTIHATTPVAATLLDCGHALTASSGLGFAFATSPDGTTLCSDCSDGVERLSLASAQPGDRRCWYVSGDGRTITTWPGAVLMPRVVWGKAHSRSATRRFLRATDPYGRIWSGSGDEGMWCVLRLTREVVAGRNGRKS